MTLPSEPTSRFYDSQGLKLHYVDWGNEAAPPLVLMHGGRDHCRSWDWIARALQPHFHIVAADLRGHGDSDWAKGSSYSMSDHIYDMTRMMTACGFAQASIVGHSFGGMVSLIYAGAYPEKVSNLVIIDGAFLRQPPSTPIDRQMRRWMDDLDKISASTPRRYRSVEDAAARMLERNRRLSTEQVQHLARHAVKQNYDGTFSWKWDPYQRVSAPYRISADDHIALWNRITCPTLFLCGAESGVPDPQKADILRHFRNGRQKIVDGAAHWVQHDKLDVVLDDMRAFLQVKN